MFVLQVTVSDGLMKDVDYLTIYLYNSDKTPMLLNLPSSVNISEHQTGDVFTVDAVNLNSTKLFYQVNCDPTSGNLLFVINYLSGMSH